MIEHKTDFGRLLIGEPETLYAKAVDLAVEAHAEARSRHFTWALTGGSTPAAWYQWCVASGALPSLLSESAHFTVSDERHVPLSSAESNFGNAERLLLAPLGVPVEHRHPWVVAWPVAEAAEAYRRTLLLLAGPGRAYDLCFLGMGDDCHTASLFPGTPLLRDDGGLLFGAHEVPDKGWRLTITPTGLNACGRIVVMAFGAAKAEALHRVFTGPHDPQACPAQLLKQCAERVTWLVDPAAAAKL